jgi:hypothetical protein
MMDADAIAELEANWTRPRITTDTHETYHRVLVKFLKVMFPALTILLQIKPSHVRRFLSLKVFGKEEYGPDDKSTEGRANSIEFDKKALSYFMPRNKIAWDDLTQMGNPTRSTEVNELIEHVKTLEGRGRGKKSQARREITLHEFTMLVGALRKMAEGDGPAGELVAYATVGVLTFMWQPCHCTRG